MPGENIQDWSVTAANNSNSDSSINWAEGQPRASVNNSARSMMAAHAKQRNLLNGSILTGGTANAQTFFSGLDYTAPIPTGLRVLLKIGPALTNTGAATLEMDGLGAVAINNLYGTALTGGEILAGSYAEFLYDGTKWLLLQSSIIIIVQTFTASGTYTPTPGMVYCIMECVGGGGGGGSVANPGGTGLIIGGGGGGSGGYSRKRASATDIGVSQVVTIGAGGAAGVNGGSTSVGSLCVANGGTGAVAYPPNFGFAGSGGVAGTGDVAAAGSPGGMGSQGATATSIIMTSGHGGSSFFGGGGVAVAAAAGQFVAGTNGGAYGGGGSGSIMGPLGGGVSGGVGSAGFVIVTEFRA